jgi:hypothetical protein
MPIMLPGIVIGSSDAMKIRIQAGVNQDESAQVLPDNNQ